MNAVKEVTNDGLLTVMQDLMQMTSEGFLRLEGRVDRIEEELLGIKEELRAIHLKLHDHDIQLAELQRISRELLSNHKAYMNDISDILDRVKILEDRAPDITEKEVRELQRLLKLVVDWALKVARTTKIPLEIT
ncbi:MAG TPA: hypothetical protein VKQ34_03805 [Candidatus Saccharimonadales bacterium]|nr:hypothetical protein [Candidatus Saccharimonadales bacterium]